MSQTKITMEEDMFETVPKHTSSWLKNIITMYYFKGSWNTREYHEAAIFAQQCFKAKPSDILLCSSPKTGTTWLKALAFAIVTREKFDISTSPLLTTLPHECIPNFINNIKEFEQGEEKRNNPLVATHFHYDSLPKSVIDSKCKIVYIYRNMKDVFVSYYNFIRDIVNLSEEDAPFDEAFDELYQGISFAGPYWDHILGYWKAGVERPGTILFIKYEDLKKEPTSNVQKLAEFIGYPFSIDEINGGVVENIINLCSFENLRNLEVNKSGKHQHIESSSIDNRLYFRKAKDGDWKNYFTKEMEEKVDKLIDEKLSATGLVLK